MISFDYMRSARPHWLQRVLELRIPEHLQSAVIAVIASSLMVAGAWGIETYRLSEARSMEREYRQRFEVSRQALQKTKVFYDQVQALVTLDQRVRAIVASGDADARSLAEIANNLPGHAWLTSINNDSIGIALEGRADSLEVVSRVLRGLLRARDLRNPTLTSAQVVPNADNTSIIKYAMHVEAIH